MSKFINGSVYMIIDDEDISTEILNYSTSMNKDTMPSKTSNGVLKRIIEIKEPVPSTLANYTWYDKNTIGAAWDALP